MTSSCSVTLTIQNELGLHARAATIFVQAASEYIAEVFVTKDGREVNGKSIMGILTLVASKGTKIHLRAEGPDAEDVIAVLSHIVMNKFGEDR
ncbi:MAG: HPr family phosphocarrier protein [Proteobacteria bacterium]|nr:HPr family phosphocarrier protein [Pseudomonadota bacterium]